MVRFQLKRNILLIKMNDTFFFKEELSLLMIYMRHWLRLGNRLILKSNYKILKKRMKKCDRRKHFLIFFFTIFTFSFFHFLSNFGHGSNYVRKLKNKKVTKNWKFWSRKLKITSFWSFFLIFSSKYSLFHHFSNFVNFRPPMGMPPMPMGGPMDMNGAPGT